MKTEANVYLAFVKLKKIVSRNFLIEETLRFARDAFDIEPLSAIDMLHCKYLSLMILLCGMKFLYNFVLMRQYFRLNFNKVLKYVFVKKHQ